MNGMTTRVASMTGSTMRILTSIVVAILVCGCAKGVRKLTERFSWRTIHYDFDSPEEVEEKKEDGYYIYGNSIITSLAPYGDKLFLATPRLKPGVPSTLNYINTEDTNARSPILKPYPSLEANEYYNITTKVRTMVSIINVKVDNCNRLWALDTGIVDELTSRKVEKPPAIFVYRLSDDTLLRKYSFKEGDYYSQTSKIRTIVIDDTVGSCEKAFAYVADSSGGLIVYSWESNQSFRVEHNYFNFDPIWGNLKTGRGTLRQVSEGLQGMALSLPRRNGYRELLFHPLISINEFSVPTQLIQNKSLAQQNITAFFHLGERGPGMQSSASYMDEESGVLLYTAIVKNSLACWSSFWGDEYQPRTQGIVDTFEGVNPTNQGTVDTFEESAYPADVTVDINGTVWVLTNKLIDFMFEKDENNLGCHIYSGTVRHIIRGTPCSED